MEKGDNIYRLLASKKLALYLFLGLAAVLIPKTLVSKNLYLDAIMHAVLCLLLVNLGLCTIQRFRLLSRATLVIHIGTMITIIGGLVSIFGYVATINIHEGATTGSVFRWDIGQDIPLGFDLQVRKIRREFYPIPVKVGVLHKGEKDSLHELKTGETFQWREFNILAETLDVDQQKLTLKIYDKSGQLIGSYDTSGESGLPADFPLAFQLVAYRDPVLKNVGAELAFYEDGKVLTEGFSRVNDPFKWAGYKFHITNVAADQYGRPYIGLQIVKDPGVYLAYAGFIILCIGCLLHLKKSFFKY